MGQFVQGSDDLRRPAHATWRCCAVLPRRDGDLRARLRCLTGVGTGTAVATLPDRVRALARADRGRLLIAHYLTYLFEVGPRTLMLGQRPARHRRRPPRHRRPRAQLLVRPTTRRCWPPSRSARWCSGTCSAWWPPTTARCSCSPSATSSPASSRCWWRWWPSPRAGSTCCSRLSVTLPRRRHHASATGPSARARAPRRLEQQPARRPAPGRRRPGRRGGSAARGDVGEAADHAGDVPLGPAEASAASG